MADRVARLAFLLACLLSLVVLFTPGSDVPSGFPVSDKVIHAGLFALLAGTGLAARIPARWLVPALASYAVVSEVLQAVLPINRDGDWRDAAVDWLGIALGFLVVRLRPRR